MIEEVHLPYRMQKRTILFSIFFFFLSFVVLFPASINEKDWIQVGVSILSLLFVLGGIAILIFDRLYPKIITITPTGIWLPEEKWSRHRFFLPYENIEQSGILTSHQQRFIQIDHIYGSFFIVESMLAHLDFEKLISYLEPEEESALPIPHSSSRFTALPVTLQFLTIKILSLLSFCGAPLHLLSFFDNNLLLFFLFFLPIVCILFGFFSLSDREQDPMGGGIYWLYIAIFTDNHKCYTLLFSSSK